jgi:hypothetical protein
VFIEPEQADWTGDGVLMQLITIALIDDTGEVEPAVGTLTPEQARDLAFALLADAEHAERLCRHRPENHS